MSGLSSRKSEPDFEKIDAESGAEEIEQKRGGGSWMPWSWGSTPTPAGKEKVGEGDEVMGGTEDVGRSSGVDT